jgi:hypothetical protein
MIIRLPVHTAVWSVLALGAPEVEVRAQVSVIGLYRPPVFPGAPPHTTSALPVHTPVGALLAGGALEVEVAVQLSVIGS